MILELADILIHPGQQAAFDAAIQRGPTKSSQKQKVMQATQSTRVLRAKSATFCKFSGLL